MLEDDLPYDYGYSGWDIAGGGGGGSSFDPNYDPYSTGIDPFGGGYFDPLNPDTFNGDPSTGGLGGFMPTANNGVNDPYGAGSSDPGFVDPTTGDWVANPGYDPSTINNLPNVNGSPDLNPDPGGQPIFYGGTFGNQGVPYDSSPIGTTLDPTKFPVSQQTVPYNHSPIGTTLDQSPITGNQSGRTSANNKKTQPAVRPQAPTPQPPSPSGGVGLGAVPGITGALPQDQKFSYTPVSIARQGAPNANTAPYDYQGQSVLGKLAGYAGVPTSMGQVPQALGIPNSLTQLRQQLGLTKAANPFGQSQNPYDSGV